MAEEKKGTSIEKWDEVNGRDDTTESGVHDTGAEAVQELLQKTKEKDLQMHGVEDMLEQTDNQIDGVINNVSTESKGEKEAKASVIEKLKVAESEKQCMRCVYPADREAR